MAETYLSHHGILGQKWGVRRYRNADGSLTSAGKARYNDDGTRKNPKDMSDEDLRSSNARLSAENQYRNNMSNSNPALKTALKVGVTAVGTALASMAYDYVKGGDMLYVNVGKAAVAGSTAGLLTLASSTTGANIDKPKGK